jgi:hypothetical protein
MFTSGRDGQPLFFLIILYFTALNGRFPSPGRESASAGFAKVPFTCSFSFSWGQTAAGTTKKRSKDEDCRKDIERWRSVGHHSWLDDRNSLSPTPAG